jgi:hypothetical protein
MEINPMASTTRLAHIRIPAIIFLVLLLLLAERGVRVFVR